jgi:hypothetical protein
MFLRLSDVVMFAVFNDSGGAMSYFWRKLEKFTGPVSELQLREVMVELAYLNLHLKERPTFLTEIDKVRELCRIVGERPSLGLKQMDRSVRGALLHHAIRHALPDLRVPDRTEKEVAAAITNGSLTFLFDDKGEFIEDSWRPL